WCPGGEFARSRRVVGTLLDLEEGAALGAGHQCVPGGRWRLVSDRAGAVADSVARRDAARGVEGEHIEAPTHDHGELGAGGVPMRPEVRVRARRDDETRSEEHTSELQS